MRLIWTAMVCFAFSLGFLSPLTWAEWVLDGGSVTKNANVLTPLLASGQDHVYIAWGIKESYWLKKLTVQCLDGGAWFDTPGPVSGSFPGTFSGYDFGTYGGTYFLSRTEQYYASSVFFHYYQNNSWQYKSVTQTAAYVSASCDNPSLAIDQSMGAIYLGWQEVLRSPYKEQIFVSHWNGAGWEQVGGSLNTNTINAAYTPSLAVYNGTPFACWAENSGVATQVYVKRLSGGGWVPVGGSLNINQWMNASTPRISVDSVHNLLYVCWCESNGVASQIYVRSSSLASASWVTVGSAGLNVDPSQDAVAPNMVIADGVPYVAWSESAGGSAWKIYVKKWNGSNWERLGDCLNVSPGQAAERPSLTIFRGKLYAAWKEGDTLYVKHFVFPPTATPTASPTLTPTLTPALFTNDNSMSINNSLIKNAKSCRIEYALKEETHVSLILYNLHGEKICTLVDETLPAGCHQTEWCGHNSKGAPVASGIYLANFKAGDYRKIFKIAVIN